MTEQPPLRDPTDDEGMKLPRWVPITISLVLLAMAFLAVYTGLTQRDRRLGRALRRVPGVAQIQDRGGAPGEPEAGASRMVHGEAGDSIPVPLPADAARTRVAVSGDANGVVPSIHLSARRGVLLRVDPADAVVYVNDKAMGTASQFSTAEQIWEFPNVPGGTFTVRLVAPGYHEYEYVVTADAAAETEVAVLEVKLAKL